MAENSRNGDQPKIDLNASSKLFLEHSQTIEIVLRHAVRQAILEHKRAGNSIAVSENGKVIWIKPEEISG